MQKTGSVYTQVRKAIKTGTAARLVNVDSALTTSHPFPTNPEKNTRIRFLQFLDEMTPHYELCETVRARKDDKAYFCRRRKWPRRKIRVFSPRGMSLKDSLFPAVLVM